MTTPEPTPSPVSPRRKDGALWPWAVLALIVILLAVTTWSLINGRLPFMSPTYNGQLLESPDPSHDFSLTSQTGERVSLSDLRGKVALLYFGYTYCPDACPMTLTELKKVLAALGDDAEQVQVVMISVDPERDTPEVLRDYLAHFDPSFMGLTGTPEEVLAAAAPYGIYFQKQDGSAATGYLVDHTTSVLAIDKEGYLRLIYSFDTPGEAIAADMKHLARE